MFVCQHPGMADRRIRSHAAGGTDGLHFHVDPPRSHDRRCKDVVDAVSELGVAHIGFKDIGVPRATLERIVERIRGRHGTCYLEVVSTTPDAVTASLATGAALGVDCILGGTDLDAARRVLGSLDAYFPFPGRPVGHPTRLEGTPAQVERDARTARERGCGGIDLLAYR